MPDSSNPQHKLLPLQFTWCTSLPHSLDHAAQWRNEEFYATLILINRGAHAPVITWDRGAHMTLFLRLGIGACTCPYS